MIHWLVKIMRRRLTKENRPSYERVRELFVYSPETGIFIRRIPHGRHGCFRAGSIAGSSDRLGRVSITVDRVQCQASHLAWLYTYGAWPNLEIDHVNRNPSDNRIFNLRLSTRAQNMGNTSAHRDSSHGLRGIYFHRQSKKWHARIMVNGKVSSLGFFSSAEEAHRIYCDASIRMRGEFAGDCGDAD